MMRSPYFTRDAGPTTYAAINTNTITEMTISAKISVETCSVNPTSSQRL